MNELEIGPAAFAQAGYAAKKSRIKARFCSVPAPVSPQALPDFNLAGFLC
jgi:hypothetical protein